jgi:LacI family transcriptional regulator
MMGNVPIIEECFYPVSTKRRPTIIDVARLANVSKTTVGRVISGEADRVKTETRQRVLDAIEELGYERNVIASSMRTDQTYMVALSIPDIMNPFWPEVARGVQDACESQGYTVALLNSDWDGQRENSHLQTVRRNRFDGIILNPITISNKALKAFEAPVVLLGSGDAYPDFDSVGSDSVAAVNAALEHLYGLGHRRIGLIVGISQRKRKDIRYACYVDFCRRRDLRLDPELIARCTYSQQGGNDAVRQLLALPQPPTAICAGNDLLAIGALLGAQETGHHVPDEVSIVGIDDIYPAQTTSPPLTTVAKPKYDIGIEAARFLLARIKGEAPQSARKLQLAGHLQVRASTRKLCN